MAKKKAQQWPPEHQAVEEPAGEMITLPASALVDILSTLKGLNQALAELIARDGLPDTADELSRKYGLDYADAENVIKSVKEEAK